MQVEFPWVATSVYNYITYFAGLLLCRATLLVLLVSACKSSEISWKSLANSPLRGHLGSLRRRTVRGILELLHH
jgi:hypothetical protein